FADVLAIERQPLQSDNHRTATHRMTIKRAEGGIYGNAMNIKLFTVRRCQHALMHFRGLDSGEEHRDLVVGDARRTQISKQFDELLRRDADLLRALTPCGFDQRFANLDTPR